MRQAVPAAVFSFKDKHSDELCYQTVSKFLEDILRDTKHVLVTLVPEQYRTYAVEAKTHILLGRPLYITTNANGDFIWTGNYACNKIYFSDNSFSIFYVTYNQIPRVFFLEHSVYNEIDKEF